MYVNLKNIYLNGAKIFFNQVQYFFHNVMPYNNKHKSKNCLSYILTTILETLKEIAS